MSDGIVRRVRSAARTCLTVLASVGVVTACGSDGPVGPGTTDDELDMPVPCASEGEAGTAYVAGVNCRTVDVEGYPREYLVYLPPGHTFTPDAPAPVVLMFHGGGGTGERFLRISRWREKADEVGLIAVFPTGLEYFVLAEARFGTRWHEYNLPTEVDPDRKPDGYPASASWPANDPAFVRAMLDDLEAEAHVDPERFYASGFSNGATFTSRLAIELTDRLAAFAYVGGGFCHEVATAWTSDAPARMAFQVFGARDPKLLAHIAERGGPVLEALPLDPDSLFAIDPVVECLVWQLAAFELEPNMWDVGRVAGVTHVEWDTPTGLVSWSNTFQLAVLEGVEHKYPNGDNNPLGWVAVDRFWEFFRDLRLTLPRR